MTLRDAFRRHPALTSAFALAATVAVLFLGAALYDLVYWSTHQREPVRPWMTIGYVARSWDLHGPDIDRLAGTPLPEGRPLTIREIARDRGVPPEQIVADVEQAVARLVAARDAGRDAGRDVPLP